MKTNEQAIKELVVERDEVLDRFRKLENFIATPEYYKMSRFRRQLMQNQWVGMDKYIQALNMRISDLKEEKQKTR